MGTYLEGNYLRLHVPQGGIFLALMTPVGQLESLRLEFPPLASASIGVIFPRKPGLLTQ